MRLENLDTSLVIAINTHQASNNAHCGKYIQIKNTSNGKTVTALVADSECLDLAV
jgi:hypothetical protein